MSLEGYCLRSGKLIATVYHFGHCNFGRKFENEGILVHVVRVTDGSHLKPENPLVSLVPECMYITLHKIPIQSSDKDINQ
jgi:hypothetical protein